MVLRGVVVRRRERVAANWRRVRSVILLAVLIVAALMRPRSAARHPILHEAAAAVPVAASLAETQLRNC
jgi:type II secretory pathway component PulL